MSRVGKKPIPIPSGVTVTLAPGKVTAKGPKGELSFDYVPGLDVRQEGDELVVDNNIGPKGGAIWGTTRARVSNIVEGVSKGFEKSLEIIGTGWRAAKAGNDVEVYIGYNHPVLVKMPEGITADVADRPPKITIKGAKKELVGQIAADIRKIRPPEPFLGKGIRYEGEYVRRKAGKSAG
ncbi:MAG: 50S ribosomal protein L6 [Candidatus Eisenbacteria bacterium]|uniref:Large ribosomal subunit protein uL6 n=1 Tax=Eiseniibacteriota bacterium TaxID=2212470 RepID=A0A956NES7_UNCEI|nr:50S ribosomal protein L6 [Candidatus Eisenbacteria bacterium]MCB9463615.1 50S ribosomal protein L6 [Candidatus Eisenbacteria bacterium]